ncbi:hypothetical protein AU468_09985 [Alkalispirochaeta sphaeroplastigenens]|uniref:Tyr recombinase domain-containing protein n=2 Tax=Alkalispirochaeta sphaeroplastigenens TaxID=1187066 RepID=A0A2S4JJW4_9SPIO|nr:hypothetical protein AU468_09985 [Alkalispirochaeta sphaeroplastigenens]
MRKGEILGLLPEHIELQTIGAALVPVIHVVSNWVEGDGRKHPKMGSTRDVPIPMFVYDAIREVIKANPWGGGPIFWSDREGIPISGGAVLVNFKKRKEAVGITDPGISFHSWRHWYNSYMRSSLDDHVLKQLTRHRSDEMTDRYTHLTEEQMVQVMQAATGLRRG